jgi:hypothetical protein
LEIMTAIAAVIQAARAKGQSLDELKAEVLADDQILNREQRRTLSDVVTYAWNRLTEGETWLEGA